jgi:hypothetical protein
LQRLGHDVVLLDPARELEPAVPHPLLWKVHFRTGYRLLQPAVRRIIADKLGKAGEFDVAWVNGGPYLGRAAAEMLKRNCQRLVLYNNDDPTGGRDGRHWDSLLQALPAYDLCAVMRPFNVGEFEARGARRVIRVWMSYDEVAHRPFEALEDVPAPFRSSVAFVGTWMRGENRDEFLLRLLEQGIPLALWGGRWEKSRHWGRLSECWRGPALSGREYVAALQGAALCLGMLSKGNRDQHTQRSLEVPYAGGLLCAERTAEHCELYREGEEAVFWSDADECATICRRLLENEGERERIRANGMRRVRALGAGNEDVCRHILDAVA